MEELRASLLVLVHACPAGYMFVTLPTDNPHKIPLNPCLLVAKHQTHLFGSDNSPSVDICPSAN